MHHLSVTYRSPQGSLSRNIAEEILERGLYGKIAVVTDKPVILLSATKKQWLELIRRMQRDRSSTLNAVKISELTRQIAWMESIRFSAKMPDGLPEAHVTFATVEDYIRRPPMCRNLYVASLFERDKLYRLTRWMTRGGQVVVYV